MVRYKPRAGEGAKARLLTKTIYPRRQVDDPKSESTVVLIEEAEIRVNRKQQQCYRFKVDGDADDQICYAIKRYVHVFEEGDKTKLFDPTLPGPEEQSKEKEKKE